MIEWMLSHIIEKEFEKVIGKGQHESRKAMHVGFSMSTGDSEDQYQICHMYIFAPNNYVHITIQEERIDAKGKRHVKQMEHLCYHDSCWRDSIQSFIFKNRAELNGFHSLLKLFDWYDVLILEKNECEYLHLMDRARQIMRTGSENEKKQIEEKLKVNPFNKRTIWKDLI